MLCERIANPPRQREVSKVRSQAEMARGPKFASKHQRTLLNADKTFVQKCQLNKNKNCSYIQRFFSLNSGCSVEQRDLKTLLNLDTFWALMEFRGYQKNSIFFSENMFYA